MKIISDFHDYYDSALVYNDAEDHVIYHRDTLEFKMTKDSPSLCRELNTKIKRYLYDDNSWFKYNQYSHWSFKSSSNKFRNSYRNYIFISNKETIAQYKSIVIFCGKIYPVVKFVKESKISTADNKTKYVYTEQDFHQYLVEHKLELKTTKDETQVHNFFSHSGSDEFKEFLMINKITNAVLEADCSYNYVKFNVKLSDYEFYKVFDTYTCFQELDMWLSGTLSYPQNLMIEVGDNSKIVKHGFDEKYGFRTRPKN